MPLETPPAAPETAGKEGQHWTAMLISIGETLVNTGLVDRNSKLGKLVTLHSAVVKPLVLATTGEDPAAIMERAAKRHIDPKIENVSQHVRHHAEVISGHAGEAKDASIKHIRRLGKQLHDSETVQAVVTHPKVKSALEAMHIGSGGKISGAQEVDVSTAPDSGLNKKTVVREEPGSPKRVLTRSA